MENTSRRYDSEKVKKMIERQTVSYTHLDVYKRQPYGWGVAEYATPEELFGYDLITSAYQREPQESKERMMQHLSSILPGASVQQLTKILKG